MQDTDFIVFWGVLISCSGQNVKSLLALKIHEPTTCWLNRPVNTTVLTVSF